MNAAKAITSTSGIRPTPQRRSIPGTAVIISSQTQIPQPVPTSKPDAGTQFISLDAAVADDLLIFLPKSTARGKLQSQHKHTTTQTRRQNQSNKQTRRNPDRRLEMCEFVVRECENDEV
jgi:hypothetical protein